MTNWCLSDNRDEWDDGLQSGAVYEESDVKEFIRRLKEAKGNCYECGETLSDETIDTLAGPKLVDSPQPEKAQQRVATAAGTTEGDDVCECGWHKCYHDNKNFHFDDAKPCDKFKAKGTARGTADVCEDCGKQITKGMYICKSCFLKVPRIRKELKTKGNDKTKSYDVCAKESK